MALYMYMSRLGLKPGMPDLDIFHVHPNKRYAGLMLEFKNRKGVVTPNQEICHRKLTAAGYCVAVVRSIDDAIKIWQEYITPDKV